jgi:hypothetical protein
MGQTQTPKAAEGTPQARPIEELSKEFKTPDWQVGGLMAAQGWAAGKELTREEYKDALFKWLKGSMAGKTKKE